MLHRHLQDVRLLQLGVSGALRRRKQHLVSITRQLSDRKRFEINTYIFFEGIQDERFQLTQALVDPRSSPLFHDRLRGLQLKQDDYDSEHFWIDARRLSDEMYPPFCAPRLSWVCQELCSCSPGLQRPERMSFFPSYLQASSYQ